MSSAITPPPPGWYPAPDDTQATWWWNGTSWLRPRNEQATLRTITKLATATQVMVIVCGVLALVLVGVEAMGITAITSYLDGNTSAVQTLHLYDWTWIVGNALATLSLTAAAALWATWQYRVALQVPGLTRRAAGWHAGDWFLPILALWRPFQDISDLWRAIGRTPPRWLIVWWLLWIASFISFKWSNQIDSRADALEQIRATMWSSILGEAFLIAAALMAFIIIRGITQGVIDRSQRR